MIVDQGLIAILSKLLRDSDFNAQIRLFTNAITIAADTVLADLTEATFPGYAAVPTASLTWPGPTINGSGEAESDGPTIMFEATGAPGSPEDCTGLYVTIEDDAAAEKLFLAFVFTDPITITLTGDQVAKKINWFCENY